VRIEVSVMVVGNQGPRRVKIAHPVVVSAKVLVPDVSELSTRPNFPRPGTLNLGCTSSEHFGQEGGLVKRRFVVFA